MFMRALQSRSSAAQTEDERHLVNVFGFLMLTATISFTFYTGIALTSIYPLVESLRDDVAFEAYEIFKSRCWGGYENFLFNLGLMCVLCALMVVVKVIYADWVLWASIGVIFVANW